jgi:hypothetical protein
MAEYRKSYIKPHIRLGNRIRLLVHSLKYRDGQPPYVPDKLVRATARRWAWGTMPFVWLLNAIAQYGEHHTSLPTVVDICGAIIVVALYIAYLYCWVRYLKTKGRSGWLVLLVIIAGPKGGIVGLAILLILWNMSYKPAKDKQEMSTI